METRLLSVFLGCLLGIATAHGATLYKWVDENGNVTYQDTPPPGNVQYEESVVDPLPEPLPEDAGRQIEEAALENPVSLYTVPSCDTCDLVRLYLESNSIPFAEKDVRNNLETQAELEKLTGTLTVPTLVIGEQVIDGYSRSAIRAALASAGFPTDVPRNAAAETSEEESDELFPDAEPIEPLDLNESESEGS